MVPRKAFAGARGRQDLKDCVRDDLRFVQMRLMEARARNHELAVPGQPRQERFARDVRSQLSGVRLATGAIARIPR